MVISTASALMLIVFHANAVWGSRERASLPDYDCPESLCIFDSMRTLFMRAHNGLRRKIALGDHYANDQKLGPVKNMYELKWDCNLEHVAQMAIESCPTNVSTNTSLSVALLPDSMPFGDYRNMISAVKQWRQQPENHTLDNATTITNEGLSEFANMAYANTTKVGCSYKLCGGSFLVACAYNKAGSQLGTVLWEKSEHQCKNDSDCTTYSGSICSNNLCVDAMNVSDSIQSTPVITKSKV